MNSNRLLWAVVAVIGLAVGAAVLWAAPETAVIYPDSAGYLDYSPIRPFAYPVFLKFLIFVGGGGHALIIPAQAAILAISCAYLMLAFEKAGLWWPVAAIVALASGVNPVAVKYAHAALSEALFIPSTIALAAAVALGVTRKSPGSLLVLCSAVALAWAIRPIGAVFAVAPFIVLVGCWRGKSLRWLAISLCIVIPAITAAALNAAAENAWSNGNYWSIVKRVPFSKAAMVDAPPPEDWAPDDPRWILEKTLEEGFRPVRDLIAEAPTFDIATHFTMYYEMFSYHRFAFDKRAAAGEALGVSPDQAAWDAGLDRLGRAPMAAAVLTFRHYISMWRPYKIRNPAAVHLYNDFLNDRRPLPFEQAAQAASLPLALHGEPVGVATWVRAAFAGIGLLSVAIILVWAVYILAHRMAPPLLSAAAAMSASVHAAHLGVAVTHQAAPRYAETMIILAFAACVVGLVWLAHSILPTRIRDG